MKPDEIRPHVGQGKRLATIEVEMVLSGRLICSSRAVTLETRSGDIDLDPDQIHSIRAVGEVCEWGDCDYDLDMGDYLYSTSCGSTVWCDRAEFTFCPHCGKPIKEASDE